jgi:ATP-dependent Clp protease ATP-binding subunit ClpC
MTSNIGARKAAEFGHGIGFSTNEESNKKSIIEKEIKRRFNPEFINRINKIIYFNSLTDDNLKNIVKLELNKFNKKLNDINYNIVYNDDVVTHIQAEAIKDKEYGARPITRIIENSIEDEITELMLTNDFQKNHTFSASVVGDKISII